MSDVVIKVENLYKEYILGTIGYGTLNDDLKSWLARLRGKEDPNAIIGQKSRFDQKNEHFLALNGVSFDVKQGEAVGIIGYNGAGKSTLLKILSRITAPTSGSVKIKGKISSLLEVGTGFHPELTGRENIYLNGAILGMKKREIDRKLDEIVSFSGIERFIDTPVKRYSSGMYVRLAFSVAAHLDSDILILDEVLAVGDAEFQRKCLGKMDEVTKNQGRTILFVSHNMSSVRNLCNRGIYLENGKVVCDGEFEKVVEKYLVINKNLENKNLKNLINRKGNGKFKFEYIEFYDENGKQIESPICYEYLKIKLYYSKIDEIKMERMIIGLSFKDDFYNPILTFLSDEMGISFKGNNENCIILEIPKLMLRPTNYVVGLFSSYQTTQPQDICDLIDCAIVIQVLPTKIWDSDTPIRPYKMSMCEGMFYG